MKYLRWIFIILALFACAASLAYTMLSLTSRRQVSNQLVTANTIDLLLNRMGLREPTWQTLVLTSSQDAPIPASTLWNTWARLEDWPAWSTRHVAARWIGPAEWVEGAQFEQTLALGFPLDNPTSTETVARVLPGISAEWCKQDNGVHDCQIWLFESLPDGRTRVTSTQILNGASIAALRPLAGSRWQSQMEETVTNLILRAAAVPPPN